MKKSFEQEIARFWYSYIFKQVTPLKVRIDTLAEWLRRQDSNCSDICFYSEAQV